MIDFDKINLSKRAYTNIFIVEDRNHWELVANKYNKDTDLVLTIDFALKKQLLSEGGEAEFLDRLMDKEILEELNYKMHDFFGKWSKNEHNEPLLVHKGLDVGEPHQLFIMFPIDYYCHFFFSIIVLKTIIHEKIILSVNDEIIIDCLKSLGLQYELITSSDVKDDAVYSFPVLKYLEEKTKRDSLLLAFKDTVANCFDFFFRLIDPILNGNKKLIYIHKYFPTNPIIEKLLRKKGIQLVLNNYTGLKNIWKERRIHYGHRERNFKIADLLFEDFVNKRSYKWEFEGYMVSDYLYKIIDKVLKQKLKLAVDAADSIDSFFKRNKVSLMVPITDLWVENRLIMNYCKTNNIPVFMIINGMLLTSYYAEAKDSDYVNCYSESIKANYYGNAGNAISLGDPRMDNYFQIEQKQIDYLNPTIIIGTAGFNTVDLNSHLAFEFDFLFDILYVIERLLNAGKQSKVILKIRSNSYVHLYESFVKEYFADMDIEIIQDQSFFEVIKRADLYISFYSQTLFEASCLGIPAIYYKKDTQFFHAPFDNKSELVTATDTDELLNLFELFYGDHEQFDSFKSIEVMQKYIGKLDGKNVDRNVDFIMNLIHQQR